MKPNKNVPMNPLLDRFAGCLLGGAIGDALGSPVEGLTPDQIRRHFSGRVEDFASSAVARRDGRHKGDGLITDDTLMTLALCRAYLARGAQLEAHDMATYFMREFAENPVWVPEFGREMLLLDRVFYPEKYMYLRLRLANIDPREAGIGNMINCGAAMYAAPVGLMNAGDPPEAYRRAIDVFSAHQSSFGLEAAGVMAACIAEALRPSATIASVIETAKSLSKDGTRAAIAAVCEAAVQFSFGEETLLQQQLRGAMEPYDMLKGGVEEYIRAGSYSSRHHAIEELPLALAYLIIGKGDYRETVLGAVNYGRDADSIAGMAGAILGALYGESALPQRWVQEISDRNRLDFEGIAEQMLALFIRDYHATRARAQQRHEELKTLLPQDLWSGSPAGSD